MPGSMGSDNLEYKREYTSDIRKELVAFANTQGGTLLIGIQDDGTVIGVPHPERVLEQIVSVIRDAIRPDLSMFTNASIQTQDGKSIIRVEVQRGTGRPYYIAEKGLKPSGVYIRLGNCSIPAADDAIRRMIKETDGDRYETTRSLNQELTFISAQATFAARGLELGESQMRTLGLLGEDGLYTNLGLLLSDQCTHGIKVAVFQGKDRTLFRDRREFGGSILKQVEQTYEYLDLHNQTRAFVQGLIRTDQRDYPEQAIREALLNAVVHRDYSFSGDTLISIMDNRMEFTTLGGLVPGLSIEAILIGVSQPRNERVANVFYRLRLIEAYGTGIPKIIQSYEGAAVQPSLANANGAFQVCLPNINHSVQTRLTPGVSSEKANAILRYLSEHETVSRRELEAFLGVGQTAVGRLIRTLMREGRIQQVDQGRHTRYRLTES